MFSAALAIPHRVDTAPPFLFIWREERGDDSGFHCGASTSPNRSTQCPKSTRTLWARKTSSLRIKSEEISATNTQDLGRRRPIFNSANATLKMGRVLPAAICRKYGVVSSLLCSRAAMSSLIVQCQWFISYPSLGA
jgi:hypothetical protein